MSTSNESPILIIHMYMYMVYSTYMYIAENGKSHILYMYMGMCIYTCIPCLVQ